MASTTAAGDLPEPRNPTSLTALPRLPQDLLGIPTIAAEVRLSTFPGQKVSTLVRPQTPREGDSQKSSRRRAAFPMPEITLLLAANWLSPDSSFEPHCRA
jgi:hypothetical protein